MLVETLITVAIAVPVGMAAMLVVSVLAWLALRSFGPAPPDEWDI